MAVMKFWNQNTQSWESVIRGPQGPPGTVPGSLPVIAPEVNDWVGLRPTSATTWAIPLLSTNTVNVAPQSVFPGMYDALAVECSTFDAAHQFSSALYADDGGRPGTLMFVNAPVQVSAVGAVTVPFPVPKTLPDKFWLAYTLLGTGSNVYRSQMYTQSVGVFAASPPGFGLTPHKQVVQCLQADVNPADHFTTRLTLNSVKNQLAVASAYRYRGVAV